MNAKNKMITLVQIAVMLCSVFLLATPAIAADQNQAMQKVSANAITTASEDEKNYVLGIYGNANEDDTIDMGDVVYTKLAIFGKKAKTELCDAKYDGRINVLDVIQTKLIILGKEKELTIIDSLDRIVTVKKPLKRIIPTYPQAIETLRTIKVPKDMVVGIGTWPTPLDPVFFAEFSDVPCIGSGWEPDVEAILELNPDAVVLFGRERAALGQAQDVLELAGITVLRFKLTLATWGQMAEIYLGEVEKLGYIFGKQAEAKEFLDWREEILNLIEDKVEKIPEEDKPKVYFESGTKYSTSDESRTHIASTGGKSIFEEYKVSGKVDSEEVVKRNPDIIISIETKRGGHGYDVDVGDIAKLKEIRDEIMSRPELQNVKAVKEGRVYILSGYIIGWRGASGCRSFLQDAYMTKWFHPDLFEVLDPKAIHQEYLTRFHGLDIDLDEKGVFAYHPEEHPDGH